MKVLQKKTRAHEILKAYNFSKKSFLVKFTQNHYPLKKKGRNKKVYFFWDLLLCIRESNRYKNWWAVRTFTLHFYSCYCAHEDNFSLHLHHSMEYLHADSSYKQDKNKSTIPVIL